MSGDKVLLAGFESFGPYHYNVAERIVEELNNEVIDVSQNTRIQIVGVKLPIKFGAFREILETAIQSIEPKIALGVGMDFKDLDHISFELLAHSQPAYGNDIRDTEDNIGSNDLLRILYN